MTLEEIKREFVRFMEEVRANEPYPRNFFGCLVSLIIDPEPVSQERIVELTGYSQATVSLTLQKLQLLMPVRMIRTRGDRKKYYAFDGPPEMWVVNLWQKRLETQAISSHQVEKMLERVKEKSNTDKTLKRFQNYLEYFLLILRILSDLRESGINDFEQALKTGTLGDMRNQNIPSTDEALVGFLESLRSKSLEYGNIVDGKEQDTIENMKLKQEYFSEFKSGLNPLLSQETANQIIVIHNVFLAGFITQQQLMDVTLLPRSTISEILKQSVDSGIIKVTQKEGSRIKNYHPSISFTDLMLGNFRLVDLHISEVLPKLVEYIKRVKKVPNSLNQKKPFLQTLSGLEGAYNFSRDFSQSMKLAMIAKLKEEHESGISFI